MSTFRTIPEATYERRLSDELHELLEWIYMNGGAEDCKLTFEIWEREDDDRDSNYTYCVTLTIDGEEVAQVLGAHELDEALRDVHDALDTPAA